MSTAARISPTWSQTTKSTDALFFFSAQNEDRSLISRAVPLGSTYSIRLSDTPDITLSPGSAC